MATPESAVFRGFNEFHAALTAQDAREVIRRRPELLSEAGLATIARIRDSATDAFAREQTEEVLAALERYAREEPEELLEPWVVPSIFVADLEAGRAAGDEFEATIAAWTRIVADERFPLSPRRFRMLALNRAADAYRQRYESAGGPPDDIETAIELAGRAAAFLRPASPDRADHINYLASLLVLRYQRTLKPEDVERSIQIGRDLLAHPPPDTRDLANTWNNLGLALMERYERVLAPRDLEEAIEAYGRARKEVRPEAPLYPTYVGNLGEALLRLHARTGSPAHLTDAIGAGEAALEAAGRSAARDPKAMLNLANALLDRAESRYAREEDLPRARALLEEAFAAFARGSMESAVVANTLASVAYLEIGRGSDVSGLGPAIEALREAAASVPEHSAEHLAILYNEGNLFLARYRRAGAIPDLEECIARWERALGLLQGSFASSPVDYKLGQQQKWTGLQRQLALALLELARADASRATAALRRAIAVAEDWKARLLTALVGRGPAKAPAAIVRYAARETELLAELTALDNAELASLGRLPEASTLERLERRERCRAELDRIWDEMSSAGPACRDYVRARRTDPLEWEDVAALAEEAGPETVLVSHLASSGRTALLIFRSGWNAPESVSIHLSEDAAAAIAADPGSPDEAIRPLMEQVAPHLPGAARVVLSPGDNGWMLPWAVLADRAGWRAADGNPMPLVSVPGMGALLRLRRRPPSREGRAVVAGDPRGEMMWAADEARDIAGLLRARPLIGDEADRQTVLELLPRASVAHFATHARFVPGAPADSGIRLADGDLTARELAGCGLSASLIVLSACETGRAESLGGDEMAGLAMALLQAGARTVLASLWPVSGIATAALMSSFYKAWQSGSDKAAALAHAMAELSNGWEDPRHWGAFALFGDWQGDPPSHLPPRGNII